MGSLGLTCLAAVKMLMLLSFVSETVVVPLWTARGAEDSEFLCLTSVERKISRADSSPRQREYCCRPRMQRGGSVSANSCLLHMPPSYLRAGSAVVVTPLIPRQRRRFLSLSVACFTRWDFS